IWIGPIAKSSLPKLQHYKIEKVNAFVPALPSYLCNALTLLTLRLLCQPLAINARRDFGGLDLAASTPENICVRNWNSAHVQMPINGDLMAEKQLFVSAVRHGHNVDVLEFRSGLAPITMRQDMMTTDLAARFNFTAGRHRPMKQRVETRDAHTAR